MGLARITFTSDGIAPIRSGFFDRLLVRLQLHLLHREVNVSGGRLSWCYATITGR
jgi:hypothetical protein